jgi:hypothetical protein
MYKDLPYLAHDFPSFAPSIEDNASSCMDNVMSPYAEIAGRKRLEILSPQQGDSCNRRKREVRIWH